MTPIPLTDCCAMLGIDAKTFRNWLRQANLEWAAHPKDARLKCLTSGASRAVGDAACSSASLACHCHPCTPRRSSCPGFV